MWQGMRRHGLAGLVVLAAMAAVAPVASASITPTITPASTAPVAAGSTGSLGLDLKFAPSSGDSPDAVTLNLPAGVLANTSVDGGACLQTADITGSTCQIGSGDVVADALGYIPITTAVNFYLVPPPAPGDLAGLAVADTTGDQIGATDAISIRPTGNPDGVGVTLSLVLPNTLDGTSISVTEIDSTFSAVRFPATCPATPASITESANSYANPTVESASTPLAVTGCAALPYSPTYALAATRDSTDKQVKLTTTITQAANESPNASVSLAFPLAVLTPSISALKELCSAGPASGQCTPVGSATASSPFYPTPLTAQAYLTGSLEGLSLTLVFPAPFPLTLVGSVDLKNNVTTFTGLPDIPLTNLTVTLNSGTDGLFSSSCATPSGTSTATLGDQNGDKTVKVPSSFSVAGCAASSTGSGTSSGTTTSAPRLTSTKVSGLKAGKPSLRFKVTVPANSPKLRSLTVALPSGVSLVRHRVHGKLTLTGISLKGGTLKSATVSKGRLVITLKKAVSSVTVTVKPAALKESAALKAKATAKSKKKRLASLKLTVITTNTKGKHATVHVLIKSLGL